MPSQVFFFQKDSYHDEQIVYSSLIRQTWSHQIIFFGVSR